MTLSIVERLSSSQKFENVLLPWEIMLLGHCETSFVRGYPLLLTVDKSKCWKVGTCFCNGLLICFIAEVKYVQGRLVS